MKNDNIAALTTSSRRFKTPQALKEAIEETFINAKPELHEHRVIQTIAEGRATKPQLRGFAQQFWCLERFNLAITGAKVSALQPLPEVTLGVGKPYDDHVKRHFIGALIDEAGTDYIPFARAGGHYELYLQFAEACGVPRSEMERADIFLPKILIPMHSFVDMARNMSLVESGVGMNWLNETRFSRLGMLMEPALQKHYGFSKEQSAYWYTHGEQDQEHSSIGPYLIEHYAMNDEIRERVWLAAARGHGIMPQMLDAIWEAYFAN